MAVLTIKCSKWQKKIEHIYFIPRIYVSNTAFGFIHFFLIPAVSGLKFLLFTIDQNLLFKTKRQIVKKFLSSLYICFRVVEYQQNVIQVSTENMQNMSPLM